VPFEGLGAVSYLPSIVTMAVSVAVRELFSVKEWCDLESRITDARFSTDKSLYLADDTR